VDNLLCESDSTPCRRGTVNPRAWVIHAVGQFES
jgi:hypothetical protein